MNGIPSWAQADPRIMSMLKCGMSLDKAFEISERTAIQEESCVRPSQVDSAPPVERTRVEATSALVIPTQ